MLVYDMGCPITNDVCDYTIDELYRLYRKTIHPEIQDLVKSLKDRQIIP